jgi:hypothetical protein
MLFGAARTVAFAPLFEMSVAQLVGGAVLHTVGCVFVFSSLGKFGVI